MNNILLRASSSVEFLISLFWRVVFIAAIFYLLTVYEENPPVIVGAIVICGLFILSIGNDEVVIYSDRLLKTDTSIAGLLWKSHSKVYWLSDITSASHVKEEKPKAVDMGIMVILSFILPNRIHRDTRNRFNLELKNGQTATIIAGLSEKKINTIVETINSLV